MPKDKANAAQGRRAADRGKYGRLSRERVLETALELVDREGLAALSMRRLGAELEVEAMALYRYADSKDALLDGLVEALYLELEEKLAAGGADAAEGEAGLPWRAELHRIARETYATAIRHQQVAPLLATRLLAVPLSRRPHPVLRNHERVLDLLAGAGLSERDTVTGYRAFTAWLLGYIFAELQAMDDDPEETDPAFRLGLHRMPARELPRLRAIAPALAAEQDGPAGLAAGLDALLDRLVPSAQ